MTIKFKCPVCGGKRVVGRKTCGKRECRGKAFVAPTGPVSMAEYPDFKERLLNCDIDAVDLAREQNISQMYCEILNRLWLDEGVELDLTLYGTLKHPSVYRGVRGKVDEPCTAN